MNENNINVMVTADDILQCQCGSNQFVSVLLLAKAKNPIIGQPPMIMPKPVGFTCAMCGEMVDMETIKTVGELKGNNPQPPLKTKLELV